MNKLLPRNTKFSRITMVLALLLGAAMELVQPCAGALFEFEETGSLITGRDLHTATLLQDGKVLIAGGQSAAYSVTATAELYDRSTGRWSATGSLALARYWHTVTLLRNGKVLVVGGRELIDTFKTAELYDPASGTWTSTGSLARARFGHTATLLSNGKVLVTGGSSGNNHYLASAELYDPSTGIWTHTGNLSTPRINHTATLLRNGKVLVAGGGPLKQRLNSTIRPVELGHLLGASPLDVNGTLRHCCPTARFWSQEVLATDRTSRAQNFTIQ
jgi:hypothetical protein